MAEKMVFVNAYKVTREFGGHEEGGWYFNRYEGIQAVPCEEKDATRIQEYLEKKYSHLDGDIYSAAYECGLAVLRENEPLETETKETPTYE